MVGRRRLQDPSLNFIFNALSIGVKYTLSFQLTNFGLNCLIKVIKSLIIKFLNYLRTTVWFSWKSYVTSAQIKKKLIPSFFFANCFLTLKLLLYVHRLGNSEENLLKMAATQLRCSGVKKLKAFRCCKQTSFLLYFPIIGIIRNS